MLGWNKLWKRWTALSVAKASARIGNRARVRKAFQRLLKLEQLELRLPLACSFSPSLNAVNSTGGDKVDFHFNSPSSIVDIYCNSLWLASVNANHLFFNDATQTSSVEVFDYVTSGPNSYQITGTGTTGFAGLIELQTRGKSVFYQGANTVHLRPSINVDSNIGIYPASNTFNAALFPKVYINGGGLGQKRATISDSGFSGGEYYRLHDNKLSVNRIGDVVFFPNTTTENPILVSLVTGNGFDTIEVRNDARRLSTMKSRLNQVTTNGGNDVLRFDDFNSPTGVNNVYQFTSNQAIINGRVVAFSGLENIQLTSGNSNDTVWVGSASGSLTGVPNVTLLDMRGGSNQIHVVDTGYSGGANYTISNNSVWARSLPNQVYFFGQTWNYQVNLHTGAGQKFVDLGSPGDTLQNKPLFNWATLGGSGFKLLSVYDTSYVGPVTYTLEEDRLIADDPVRNLGSRVFFPASPMGNPLLQVNVHGSSASTTYIARARSRRLSALPQFGILDAGGIDYLTIDDTSNPSIDNYTFNEHGGGSSSAVNRVFYNQTIEYLYFETNASLLSNFVFEPTDRIAARLPFFYIQGPANSITVNDSGSSNASTTLIERNYLSKDFGINYFYLQYDSAQSIDYYGGVGNTTVQVNLGPLPGWPVTNFVGGGGTDRIIYNDAASSSDSLFTISNGSIYRGMEPTLVGNFSSDTEEIELRGGNNAEVTIVLQGQQNIGPMNSSDRRYIVSGIPLNLTIDSIELSASIAPVVTSSAAGVGSTVFPGINVSVEYTQIQSLTLEKPPGGIVSTSGYNPSHYLFNQVETIVVADIPPILDINTTTVDPSRVSAQSSNPREMTNVNGIWFFVANDSIHGHELWRTNGLQSGTFPVKDIRLGSVGSYPHNLINVNGTLYFRANDGTSGPELWKSDGTAEGTVQVKEIRPGYSGSNPTALVNMNGVLFFVASDGVVGAELWRSDGTESGTYLVKDIETGTYGSYPQFLVNVGGTLFFSAGDTARGRELWKSDGTASGTELVADIRTGPNASSPSSLTNVNGTLLFRAADDVNGYELWRSDGTATGTQLVRDIRPGSPSSYLHSFVNSAGKLFFVANDGVSGTELWASDGTTAGTSLVKNIRPGNSSYPSNLTNVNGSLFFAATDSVGDRELWVTDGTEVGTVRVMDIFSGSTSSNPNYLTNVDGTLFFAATNDTHGRELWSSNGTESSTKLVSDIRPGSYSSTPRYLANMGGRLLFAALDGVTGLELWISDGTQFGTRQIKDIRTGGGSSTPEKMVAIGNDVFFVANDGIHGTELWKSDGTQFGTVLVKDINPGSASSYPLSLINFNGTLFFTADDGMGGFELWKSDGSESGTVRVADIRPGAASSFPFDLVTVGNTLYFTANNGSQGYELWKTDGTQSGTVLVKDIHPGSANSVPGNKIDVNGTLFFNANDGSNGYELWRSDGTPSGTLMVRDIRSGIPGSYPFRMFNANGTLYFAAANGSSGQELWRSDGTFAGTVRVKDINPGISSSYPNSLAILNGTLFFSADDGTNGTELWRSDDTEPGTVLVKNIRPGSMGSIPENLIAINGVIYFSADDGSNGSELWRTDGTSSGTVLVRDIRSGAGASQPQNFVNANGLLYFTADDGIGGVELWRSDGTESGTEIVMNISQSGDSSPNDLTLAGNKLFFSARTFTYGRELYAIDVQAPASSIVGSHVYYADSALASMSFENALDNTKQLAKEGVFEQSLTFDNLVNSSRGINGLVFDIQSLPGGLSVEDFEFQMSPQGAFDLGANPPNDWQNAPSSTTLSVSAGSTSRVILQWPNNTIENRWLRVTVKANANTGLSQPEVYYLGHLLGETTGPVGEIYTVSFADITPIRGAVGQSASAGNFHDIDKSGTVSFADISAMRGNIGSVLSNITIPAAGGGGGGGSVPMHGSSGDSASRDKKLSLPTQKLDSPTHSIAPLEWARSVDQVLTRRDPIALSELYSGENRQLGLDSVDPLPTPAKATVRSGLPVHLSRGPEVNSSRQPSWNPLESRKIKSREFDYFFIDLSMEGS